MKLFVKRHFKGPKYTIGRMYIELNDKMTYLCDTMEDVCRIVNNDCSMKVYGETAIPEGTYRVELVWWGQHNNHYPMLINVPCFDGILIHSGTTEKDSLGCILVGFNKEIGKLQGGLEVMDKLRELLKDQHNVTIEIS